MADVNGGTLDRVIQLVRDYSGIAIPLVAFAAFVLIASRFVSGGSATRPAGRVGVLGRMGHALAKAFTTNWQLTLLATTAFVLSLASGWTTWDGMKNFTGEPILSLMVTFGIQGVMLIIAWLIGESFATGMSQKSARASGGHRLEPAIGMLVGILFAISLLAAVVTALGGFEMRGATSQSLAGQVADKAVWIAAGLLLIATLLINNKSDVAQPYLQSVRIMAKNAVLWVMFLSCAATSVFFSFDSLFTAIFPQSERQRAAEIRSINQVAGVVADIGALTQRRQAEEADRLFQSDGWKAYEKQLTDLTRQSQGAERDIEAYFVQQMEARRRAIAEQQERIASAQSGQAGLLSKKGTLTDELSRLKGERPTLAAELAEKKTELENRAKGIDAKRVEAMAEEKGAEGTLKVGKGPQYRERVGELGRLQDAYKIQDERVKDAQKRFAAVDTRVAQIERELAAVDGDIAKLKGEASTAENRIKVAEQSKESDEGPKVDPARVRSAFERVRAEFRQEPTVDKLNALATQCTHLYSAMAATPATKERVRGIDCDPKQANEASARVFALNAGLDSFAKHCAGGDKLPQTGGTDALLTFGRKCLQDSGLPSKDSADMSAKIASIDLNRDDKAHRFVVTWNAFQDGNRLAYLALAIAIAIDSLVFMSGLFGATAVRSPLSEVPTTKARSGTQLEAVIENALLPEKFENARIALDSMHADTTHEGFVAEVDVAGLDPESAVRVQKLLKAGVTIGAVVRDPQVRSRYHIRGELYEFLAILAKRTFEQNKTRFSENIEENHRRAELERTLMVALLPREEISHNAELILSHLDPRDDNDDKQRGFTSEIDLARTEPGDRPRFMRVLNAGAAFSYVQPVMSADRKTRIRDQYYVHAELYKTLARIRARTIYQAGNPQLGHAPPTQALQGDPVRRLQAEAPRALEDKRRGHESEQRAQPSAPAASVPSVPPVPRSDAGRTPPPLPHGGGVAAQAEPQRAPDPRGGADSLGSRIRAEIIQLGGLHAWSDREIAIAVSLGENSEPEQALRRLTGRAPVLAKLVADAIEDYRGGVQGAYEALKADAPTRGDLGSDLTVYLDVLETEAGKLMHLMPVLMLSPGGPYQQILERVIYDLEPQSAEGALSPPERVMLAHVQQQAEALSALADKAPDRLTRVARIIDSYEERPAQQQQAQWEQTDKRTLN